MNRRTLLSGLTILPLTARKGIDASFRRQVSDAMAVAPVPCAVIGRIEKGALAWVEAIGDCTGDTVFQAASLTKQVTAYVAFALRDQGKLDFAAPLVRYVDDITDERSRRVTLRHVLSHSGGFPNWRNEAGQGLVSAFEPGEKWQYSGEGYVYLQRIIEHATNKSFWSVAEEIVFRPLEMQSTALCWVPELAGRFAEPHRRRGEPVAKWDAQGKDLQNFAKKLGKNVRELRYEDSIAQAREAGVRPLPNWVQPNAAASMVTTANDYARFVSAATKNVELRTPQVTMRTGKDWMLGWGLGWGIERAAGREYLWQWGDNGGYKNVVFAEPASGSAVFVFTNGDAGQAIYDRVVRHVTKHDHPALLWI